MKSAYIVGVRISVISADGDPKVRKLFMELSVTKVLYTYLYSILV